MSGGTYPHLHVAKQKSTLSNAKKIKSLVVGGEWANQIQIWHHCFPICQNGGPEHPKIRNFWMLPPPPAHKHSRTAPLLLTLTHVCIWEDRSGDSFPRWRQPPWTVCIPLHQRPTKTAGWFHLWWCLFEMWKNSGTLLFARNLSQHCCHRGVVRILWLTVSNVSQCCTRAKPNWGNEGRLGQIVSTAGCNVFAASEPGGWKSMMTEKDEKFCTDIWVLPSN